MEKTLVKKWFMIHTYSGYEKKVKTDLEQKIETLGMGDIVTKILVPEEETIEEVRGKKKTVARKIFPGYVMLEMVATREESNEGINFRVGSDPIPMEDEEVKNIFEVIGLDLTEEEKELKEVIKINFAVGDYVKVLKGGFADQEGKVAEIDMEHKKAKVMIEMFGRMTPVEVDFDSVQKAN